MMKLIFVIPLKNKFCVCVCVGGLNTLLFRLTWIFPFHTLLQKFTTTNFNKCLWWFLYTFFTPFFGGWGGIQKTKKTLFHQIKFYFIFSPLFFHQKSFGTSTSQANQDVRPIFGWHHCCFALFIAAARCHQNHMLDDVSVDLKNIHVKLSGILVFQNLLL